MSSDLITEEPLLTSASNVSSNWLQLKEIKSSRHRIPKARELLHGGGARFGHGQRVVVGEAWCGAGDGGRGL